MAVVGDDGKKGAAGLNCFTARNLRTHILSLTSILRVCKKCQAAVPQRDSHLFARLPRSARASGLFGVQSSGGKATRQKVGCGAVNSRPISALPPRTGPRNATWHSCSSSVLLFFMCPTLPL